MLRTKRRGATPAGDEPCPMTAALAAVGGKWNLIILYWLALKPRRFYELREAMPSISQKVLTQTLRDLEANGLVVRSSSGRRPPTRVEYSLSSHGESLVPVVEAVRAWGHRHLVWTEAHRDRKAQAAAAVRAPPPASAGSVTCHAKPRQHAEGR
jgi:DNA-binding HxlR family transcriptional regulator